MNTILQFLATHWQDTAIAGLAAWLTRQWWWPLVQARIPWLQTVAGPVTVDSDDTPGMEAAAYIESICTVPATPDQHVAALRAGLSRAAFMLQILQEQEKDKA